MKKCMPASWAMVVILSLAGLAGCNGDGNGTPDDGTTEELTDPAVDETTDVPEDEASGEDPEQEDADDDGGGGETLTVIVLEATSEETPPPIEGAIVALDAPGGERFEEMTGADGSATFTGLDFSLGAVVTATAYKNGYIMHSQVAEVEDGDELEVRLIPPFDTSEFVELSGTAQNMTSTAHYLLVEATVQHEFWQAIGDDWSVPVEPGVPFSLVAIEFGVGTAPPSGRGIAQVFYGWTVVEHEAVTGPTNVEIDFADAVTPTTVHGSFALPSRPESTLRSMGYSYFYVNADRASVGFPTLTDISEDGESYDYDAEYIELPGTEVSTRFIAFQGTGEAAGFSYVDVEGPPTDGAHDFGMLDQPEMITPEGPETRYPLHDPITWEIFDSDVDVYLDIFREEEFWIISLLPGSTTTVIPELPSTVDSAEFLGTDPVFCRVAVKQVPDSSEVLMKQAMGIRLRLAP